MLTTLHRFNPMLGIRTRAYWSSKGSAAEDSAEWLLLRLAHPACLVRSVAVRPFRATFQRVRPASEHSLCARQMRLSRAAAGGTGGLPWLRSHLEAAQCRRHGLQCLPRQDGELPLCSQMSPSAARCHTQAWRRGTLQAGMPMQMGCG